MKITSSKFVNNHADESGGAIYISDFLPIMDDDNIFKNNTAAKYGNNLASYAIRLALKISMNNSIIYNSRNQGSKKLLIKNEYPGINLKILLKFEALDHFNQTVADMENE